MISPHAKQAPWENTSLTALPVENFDTYQTTPIKLTKSGGSIYQKRTFHEKRSRKEHSLYFLYLAWTLRCGKTPGAWLLNAHLHRCFTSNPSDCCIGLVPHYRHSKWHQHIFPFNHCLNVRAHGVPTVCFGHFPGHQSTESSCPCCTIAVIVRLWAAKTKLPIRNRSYHYDWCTRAAICSKMRR